ncbi:zinc-finger homeodomain protein 2-like [Cornus florida]|uniref:zinc-finger homeodomain protein 2-like n=1 Tax=Cornus florida TaxID=4283 RepID=UPI0028A2839F|nr:zinc-finger homeodomain protein 2-like [Cornus florida]
MEYDEHDEDQEEQIGVQVPPTQNYESVGRPRNSNSGGGAEGASAVRKGGGGGGTYRYRECLKNHAVGIGGHAVDGCGEFMAAGEEGTLDALRCAACNCHRNFHRKETEGESPHPHQPHHQFSPYYHRTAQHAAGYLHVTPPPPPLALPSASREDQEDVSNPSSSGGGGGGSGGSRKRFRTKFTQEQKDKMLGFAERLGWRIQKHDEASVEQFCAETGVKRQVLKVWMHNNKHTLGKKP